MDASEDLIYIFYAIVALFALGTIFSGFCSGEDGGGGRDPAHGQVSARGHRRHEFQTALA